MILVRSVTDLTTYLDKFQNNRYLKDSFKTWKSNFDANLEHRYVCCFSKKYDDLPLWACTQVTKVYASNLKEKIIY